LCSCHVIKGISLSPVKPDAALKVLLDKSASVPDVSKIAMGLLKGSLDADIVGAVDKEEKERERLAKIAILEKEAADKKEAVELAEKERIRKDAESRLHVDAAEYIPNFIVNSKYECLPIKTKLTAPS